MPTDTAATCPCSGFPAIRPRRTSCSQASARATKPPVMEAVRVPPSACSTSQSMVTVRSPSALRSATARSERPMSRWISWVRPLCLPRAASRAVRVCVERGSMPYSAVIQPWDLPRRNAGTVSSTLAVHSTWVSPHSIRTEPSAWRAWRRVKLTRRSSSTSRPEGRPMGAFLIPEPAERRRGGVVAGGAAALHGACAELEQLPAQLPGAAELGGDLGVGERAPQSVGASHDDVVWLERQLRAELHDLVVRLPERQVEEPERIEERLRRVPESVQDHPLGDGRGARAVGVAAHAVDDHQQRRALGDRGHDPVLILLAPAEQAHVCVFDPQEEFHASVRLARALYHLRGAPA